MNFAIYFFNEDVNYRIRHKRLIKDWIQKNDFERGKDARQHQYHTLF